MSSMLVTIGAEGYTILSPVFTQHQLPWLHGESVPQGTARYFIGGSNQYVCCDPCLSEYADTARTTQIPLTQGHHRPILWPAPMRATPILYTPSVITEGNHSPGIRAPALPKRMAPL